jgi:cyclic pyranopterin phosphate synthase
LVEQLAKVERSDGGGPISVTLTTNGHLLAGFAAPLAAAGLRGITVSVDSLVADRFREITRRGEVAAVLEGIDAAQAAGLTPIKINTVAVRGFNDDELGRICEWAWERDLHPRFIELMPMSSGRLFVRGQLMSAREVRAEIARSVGAEIEADEAPGVRALGPASYWRVSGGRWAGRTFGTIGAMTENFCDGCNRLRLSATGRIHGCLAHDDALDLGAALRSGDDSRLEQVVRGVLQGKRDGHAFALDGGGGPRKAMISIGG